MDAVNNELLIVPMIETNQAGFDTVALVTETDEGQVVPLDHALDGTAGGGNARQVIDAVVLQEKEHRRAIAGP